MRYFVTVNKIEKYSNLSKKQAITIGKKEQGIVGIGRIKRKNGKLVYVHLPLHFFI